MPYSQDYAGVYKLVNKATGQCYVGQSQRVKKRIKEHFRLLRWGKHSNPKLQHAFNKYGEKNFEWSVAVYCDDVNDLDPIENAFISGDAWFDEPVVYNIADFAKAPMRGKKHSEEVKVRIRIGRRATNFDYTSEAYRKTLVEAQHKRFFSDPAFVAKIRFIVENDHMSYAERGRAVGADTSSARKFALKYSHLKGKL
jgi:group I intron endonuclease